MEKREDENVGYKNILNNIVSQVIHQVRTDKTQPYSRIVCNTNKHQVNKLADLYITGYYGFYSDKS